MIIRFWETGQEPITIDDDRGEKLRIEVNRELPKMVHIEGYGTYAKASIKSMVPSKRNDQYKLVAHLPPNAIDLTDKERQHKIEKLREMRQKFMDRRL